MSGSVAGLERNYERKTNFEVRDRRPPSHPATSIGKNGSDQHCNNQHKRNARLYVSEDVCTSQIFAALIVCTQQLTMTITWYISQGPTFRVPLSTLQKAKKQGDWDLIHIAAKCRTLLLSRMELQSKSVGTVTSSCLEAWKLTGPQANTLWLRGYQKS
jgi:hypothetical protein